MQSLYCWFGFCKKDHLFAEKLETCYCMSNDECLKSCLDECVNEAENSGKYGNVSLSFLQCLQEINRYFAKYNEMNK